MIKKPIYYAILSFSALIGIVASVLRLVAIKSNSGSPSIELYSVDRNLTTDFVDYFYIFCLVFIVVAALFCRGVVCGKKATFSQLSSRISFAFLSLMSAGVAIWYIVAEFTRGNVGYENADYYFMFNYSYGDVSDKSFLFMAVIACLILSSAYFAFAAFDGFNKKPFLFSVASFAPVAFAALKLVQDFLLQNRLMAWGYAYNYHLLSYAFLLLFFVNETRFSAKQTNTALYVLFGLCAAVTLLVFAVPTVVLSLAWLETPDHNFVFCLLDILMAIYIFVRLFTFKLNDKVKA